MATAHPDHPELVEVEVSSSLTGTRRMVMFRDEYEMSLAVGEHIDRRLREQLMPGASAAGAAAESSSEEGKATR